MRQVLQSLRDGTTEVADVPCPTVGPGQLLIRTTTTLISPGTERSLVEFGKGNLLSKAKQQPEKVQQVLDKIRTDGLLPTIEAVMHKLDQPLPLGYCNVGRVVRIGGDVAGFSVGDRVVSNGRHAEFVAVPARLCARVPDGVSDDDASFTVLAAIALQGIRLVQPTLGETVAVMGLGLVGLLAVQLLRAQGCQVVGIDFNAERLALAERFGARTISLAATPNPVATAVDATSGRGIDAVLVTAATASSEPIEHAAQMCRKRGRIVLVGVTGLDLKRSDFYEKELTFQVSCSYGPGRYDSTYEEKGIDYPIGFVRWTEQRNFEAVLGLLADGRLDMRALVSTRLHVEHAAEAYRLVLDGQSNLGILIDYPPSPATPDGAAPRRTVAVGPRAAAIAARSGQVGLAVIGAGNYASAILIPAFKAAGARLDTIASRQGVSALHAARKHGFRQATTDVESILADPDIGAVVIATRHDTHAPLSARVLAAGKHVFVEKPLALDHAGIDAVVAAWDAVGTAARPMLMVGFNRRFSPLTVRMRALLATESAPKAFVITVNAGRIPAEHWTQDPAVGGGRILGEGCHFIDLARHLAAAPITGHDVRFVGSPGSDSAVISLGFADGSCATIHYLSNGNRRVPKERVEVFVGGKILQLDNFRGLAGYGWPGFSRMGLWRQDKGQRECARAFLAATQGEAPPPIPPAEILEVARVSVDAATPGGVAAP